MKYIVFILVSLVLVSNALAAAELYTKTYKNGQTFEFQGHNFLVEQVVGNYTHIRGEQYGQILAINHCHDLQNGYFCIDDSENGSADITFWGRIFNISLERTYLETINVSTEYRMILQIKNNYDTKRFVTLEERTNLTVTNQENFPQLYWEGNMAPGEERILKYKYRADTQGEHRVIATILDGTVSTEYEEEIEADDFVTYSTDYEENPLQNVEYNFSLTYSVSGVANNTITIQMPAGANITHKGNFTRENQQEVYIDTNDTSETLWFTYVVEDRIDDHIEIWHDITRNGVDTTRVHKEKITGSGFSRLFLVHETQNIVRVNESITIPVQVFNPNDKAIAVAIEITGLLYNKSWNPTIKANNASRIDITVTPKRAGKYSFTFAMEYDDENGDDIEQTGSVLLEAVKDIFVPIPNVNTTEIVDLASEEEFATLEYPAQAVLLAQPSVHEHEEHIVRIELVGIEGHTANVSLVQDNIEIYSQTYTVTGLTDTIRVPTIGPGIFTATIRTDNNVFETTANVTKKEKRQITTLAEPAPESTLPIIWIIGVALAILGAIFYFVRKH